MFSYYQQMTVKDCILKEVFLPEQFQRASHFVESDRPLLPFLIPFSHVLCILLSRNNVVSPRFTHQNGVASESINKLLIPR
jgi:hypothetical protein